MKVWVKCLVHEADNTDILAIAVDEECADRVIVDVINAREEVSEHEETNELFFDLIDREECSEAVKWVIENTHFKITVNQWWAVADHNVEEKLNAVAD